MKQQGFTLLELLVAVAILAIMFGMAYRGLDALLEARERVATENQKWRAVELFFARIDQDLQAIVDRPIRDVSGLKAPALIMDNTLSDANSAQLEFTRMGLGSAQGNTQRVGYRVKNQKLELLIWPVLDRAPRTEPEVTEIIPEISGFELRALDANGAWQTQWRTGDSTLLPRAIEVQLELPTRVRVQRIFALR